MKRLFGSRIAPSCSYCMNGKKDVTMEVFCAEKLRYIKDDSVSKKCRKYRYDPYERVPNATLKLPKYDRKDFVL